MQRKVAMVYWLAKRYGKAMTYPKAMRIAAKFTQWELERIWTATTRKPIADIRKAA